MLKLKVLCPRTPLSPGQTGMASHSKCSIMERKEALARNQPGLNPSSPTSCVKISQGKECQTDGQICDRTNTVKCYWYNPDDGYTYVLTAKLFQLYCMFENKMLGERQNRNNAVWL